MICVTYWQKCKTSSDKFAVSKTEAWKEVVFWIWAVCLALGFFTNDLMLHLSSHGSPSLNISLPLFSPFLHFIFHIFIPLTNLPYSHRLSLSDSIYPHYCLLQLSGHLTPPSLHHSLTILILLMFVFPCTICANHTYHTYCIHTVLYVMRLHLLPAL